jgi:hypothetical protein
VLIGIPDKHAVRDQIAIKVPYLDSCAAEIITDWLSSRAAG